MPDKNVLIQVGLGYRKRPEKNAAAFVRNPFFRSLTGFCPDPKAVKNTDLLYRSGDLVSLDTERPRSKNQQKTLEK